MKVHLLYPDRAFIPQADLAAHTGDLEADLGTAALVKAMGAGDRFLEEMARGALLQPLTEAGDIRYRQQVLEDCLRHPDTVAALYGIAVEALETQKRFWSMWKTDRPSARLGQARARLVEYVTLLRRLRAEVDAHGAQLTSPGFTEFRRTVQHELPDAYLDDVQRQLALLEFRSGMQESVRLGQANTGIDHVLRTPRDHHGLADLLSSAWIRHTVTVADRDMAGLDALAELREHGLAVSAEAVGQSADHVKAYFTALRQELGFYLACLNLHAVLTDAGLPVCVPRTRAANRPGLVARQLYEPTLPLHERSPVGSDVVAEESQLIVITGANQGGKSTFLRALGLAQLMMQAGMFVAADAFSAPIAFSVLTHFRREEDPTMVSGKFDEELARMSAIVDASTPGALLLCNESFSSTNEREAAIIGAEVIHGLTDAGVHVCLVTHAYELAERLRVEIPTATFLRAARLEDGTRSHEIVPGKPLRTSFGADLYEEIFGEPLTTAPSCPPSPAASDARGGCQADRCRPSRKG